MGQQQLLLVVLVVIIVGIATVVAINTFSGAGANANLDAVRADLAAIAASAQSYYLKPANMGGGGKSYDGITFEGFAVPGELSEDGMELTNQNGTYTFVTRSGNTLTIQGEPSYEDNPTLQISNDGADEIDDFSLTEVEEE